MARLIIEKTIGDQFGGTRAMVHNFEMYRGEPAPQDSSDSATPQFRFEQENWRDVEEFRSEVFALHGFGKDALPKGPIRVWQFSSSPPGAATRRVNVYAYKRTIAGTTFYTYVTSGYSDEKTASPGMSTCGMEGQRVELVLYASEVSDDHVGLIEWACRFGNVAPNSLVTFTDDRLNPLRSNPRLNYVWVWSDLPIEADAQLLNNVSIGGDVVRFRTLVCMDENEARRLWDTGFAFVREVQRIDADFVILREGRQPWVVA